jgi:hypothetical protein
MVGASQKVLGGTLFGTSTALARGAGTVAKFLAQPFGAAGKAIGSVAGGATDLLGITDKATRMGYKEVGGKFVVDTSKTFQGDSYFTKDLSGQTLAEVKAGELGTIGTGKVIDPDTGKAVYGNITADASGALNANVGEQISTGPTTGDIMKSAAINQGFNLASSAITSRYFSEDPRGQSDSLYLEGKTPLTPLQVWASQNNIDIGSVYDYPRYGTGDPGYMMNAALFSQDTIGSPVNLPITGDMNA